jgi:hypothetical protein
VLIVSRRRMLTISDAAVERRRIQRELRRGVSVIAAVISFGRPFALQGVCRARRSRL